MRTGLAVLGHRMARRGDRTTATALQAIACLAIAQIALALVVGLFVADRALGDRLGARDVGRTTTRSGERSAVAASTDLTRQGDPIARFAVVTEQGPAPGFGGTSIGGFAGCVVSPALRARTATDATLAERYCGARPVRTMPRSALLQPDELVAIDYRRGPLPADVRMDPNQTVTMGRAAVPWLWASRRTDALTRLLTFLAPVALAALLSMRSALAALQRRDAPWADALAVLGADRRGVALFTAALSLPAASASSVLAVIVTLALWRLRVYGLVLGHQLTPVGALAPVLVPVIPLCWSLMAIASVLPRQTGTPRGRARRHGRAVAGLVIAAPVMAAAALGRIGGLDRTQRLVALYAVALWLLAASPAILRTAATTLITPLVARRPGHRFLVPWRTVLGGVRAFSRSAAPLLAGSLVLAITLAASHLLVDSQVAFVRQSVATGRLGTGFSTTTAAPLPRTRAAGADVRLDALMIDPGSGRGPVRLLAAPCRSFEAALDIDLPCRAAGVRLGSGSFVPPPQRLPTSTGAAGGGAVVDQIAMVDPQVPALLGATVLVFDERTRAAARAAWGPGAEITPVTYVGGSEASLQRARTAVYDTDPSAVLGGPRSELASSATRYAVTIRRSRALAALLLILLVAGQAVGSAAQRRADRSIAARVHLMGAAPAVTRGWTAIRQVTEMAIVTIAAWASITGFALAADRLDIFTGRAEHLRAAVITTAILGASLALQLGLGAGAHRIHRRAHRTPR